jgi:hypothetical protein
MTGRAVMVVVVLILIPLGVATWILATYTIGESLYPNHAVGIGFAVALLTVMAASYLLLLSDPPDVPNVPFGITLVICGAVCILVAVILQFYLASLTGDTSRRIAELLAEALKQGQPRNVNLNTDFPQSVRVIPYMALFAGIWLAIMGIRIGVVRSRVMSRDLYTPKYINPNLPQPEEDALRPRAE